MFGFSASKTKILSIASACLCAFIVGVMFLIYSPAEKPELIKAVINNDLPKIRKLAKQPDFNVNVQDNNGSTALMYAATQGKIEVIKELANFPNIDANMQDNFGITALMDAAYHGSAEGIKELSRLPNINLNAQDNDGFTALMDAIKQKQIEAM